MKLEEPPQDLRDSPIPVEWLAEGRTVLVRGPAMSGKYDLLLELLGALTDRALFVSTSRQAADAREDFAAVGDPDRFGVVDCSSRVGGRNPEDEGLTRYASSPQNLTEVGVKFTELVEAFEDDGPTAVGVHSLSELLMYRQVEEVYQFLRVLLTESRGLEWPTVAVVDDDAADDQAVTTLTQPFDAVITTRQNADGRAFRYQETGEQPEEWAPF